MIPVDQSLKASHLISHADLIEPFLGFDDPRAIYVALEVKVVAETHLNAISAEVVELVDIDAVPVV